MRTFGRPMLGHWLLDPEVTYLNHGTVGAPPKRVLQRQQTLRDEMERQPSRFMLRELNGEQPMPWRHESRLREAIAHIAPFVGARPEDLVFVPNVTTGLNAVLRSVPLGPADEVVIPILREWDFDAVLAYMHGLACEAGRALTDRWATRLDTPDDMIGALVTVPLPESAGTTVDDATRLRLALLAEDRIEVQLHAWRGRLWTRVSAQVYNDRSDIMRLADAVHRRVTRA